MARREPMVFLILGLAALVLCADAQMAAAPVICRLAEVHPRGYPTEMADEFFARLVEQKTGGRIKIKVCYNSVLGSEDQCTDQTKLGIIEFLRVSTSPILQVYKPIGVFSMPYVFRSQEHMWKVLNGLIGKHFLDAMSSAGLVGLGYFDGGARNFYAATPLKNVGDLRGLKIRVQSSPIMIDMAKLLGATGVPIAYAEVYSALQTGVVDGAENNVPSWVSQNHYEIAKYMIKDGHLRLPEVLACSKKFWDTLPEDYKVDIREAAQEATAFQIRAWNEYEVKAFAQAKAKGCTIAEVDVAQFRAALAPLYGMPKYAEYKVWIDKIRATK
ncbi:MAG: TRAP transporter substrate-binding protein [Bacteroidota bacterium]